MRRVNRPYARHVARLRKYQRHIDSKYCNCYNDGMDDTLMGYKHAELHLEALVQAAAELVASARLDQTDGRVAERPDSRGVRYYQTSGLVSKPLRYDGRQAVYGFQHLLQLVAVKLLQAEGLSLAQVQQTLAGMSTSRLERLVSRALAPVPLDGPIAATDGRSAREVAERFSASRVQPEAALDVRRVVASPLAEDEGADPEIQRRRFITEEVAHGVYVTIDTHTIASADAVLTTIEESLEGLPGGQP